LEYFERRLVSTLNSSWQGEDSYIISYTEIFRDAGVEVQGAVRLSLEKDSKSFEIWFGLGPEAISAISELWRDELKKKWLSEKGSIPKVDTSVSASLGFLSIKPSELIDYTRSGALISLDLEELSQVHLLSDSKPWGSGSLVRGKSGRYLEVKSFQSAESNLGPHETLVSLEISKIELSPGEMLEGSQEGAVLTLNDYANSDLLGEDESVDRETLRVSLVVGGEELAIGDLLMLDGKPTVLIS